MIDANKIYNTLPQSWSELKLGQFIKLMDVKIIERDEFDNLFVGVDNTLRVIASLADVTVDELEELPVKDLNRLGQRIGFIFTTAPKTDKKLPFELKKVEEFTYNNYVTLQMFNSNPFPHLHTIVSSFSKEPLTEEDVLGYDVETVMTAFFLLLKDAKRLTKRLILYSILRLIKQTMKEMWQKTNRFMRSLTKRKTTK